MTDEKRQRILERIRKMLNMAEGQANTQEAAVAAAMAEKTMRKYQISQADVLAVELDKDDVEDVKFDNKTKTMPTWVDWIGYGVAVANECEIRRIGGRHTFYGVGGDAQVAVEMMKYLVKEVNRLATKFPGNRGERGSFRRGAAGELQSRLKEIARERKQEFEQTTSGKDLIVVKKQLIEQSAGKFKYGSGSRRYEGRGYLEGRVAGGNINLQKQVGNQNNRRLA